MNTSLETRLNRLQLLALIVGAIALAVSALGAFVDARQFFYSYLFALVFWAGLSLGCFVVTMLHQLTGGRWGYPTRRFFEAGFLVLPLMLLLFVPIFFGLHNLYPWARTDEVAVLDVLQERRGYQNAWGFVGRQIFFLVVMIGLAALLRKWSLQQDATTDATPTRKARTLSGPGIVAYGLFGTFAAVDWIMSLEAHWYSSLFAVIVLSGQILTAFAFAIVLLTLFKGHEPIASVLTRTHYHHLGNLLLTFVLFWTYVSFGQLLIIYSGDLPEELEWYLHRIAGGWKGVIVAIAIFHFFVPFLLLLFRAVKWHSGSLTALAALLLLMQLINSYWHVMPALHREGLAVSWMDFTTPIGIGGLWLGCFLWRLKAAPLLPRHDPGKQFSFAYGH